jgi:iron complex outermembrane receptor protein
LLALPLIALLATNGRAQSDADADILDSEAELLLFEDIPTVYAASKYEQRVTDVPSSISIVTAEEIEAYGYRNISEVLQSLRGFYTTNDYNYGYAGVRGFGRPGDYNTRLLFLLDGHRINENLYGAEGIQNDFPVDIDLIDRIEVVRGSSSSLYGTSAFFGVINIITKRGRDLRDSEVSLDVADNGTYGGRLTYGDRYDNGMELLLSGSYYESDGVSELYFPEFDDPATNNGIAQDVDSSDHESLFARLARGNLEVEAAYVSRTKFIPTASYETVFNDPQTNTVDKKLFVGARYVHNFDSTTSLTTQIEYVDYEYWGDYPYDYADPGDPPDIIIYKDLAWGRSWETQAVLSKRFDRHVLTLGAEYRDNFQLDQKSLDIFDVYLDDQRDSNNAAVFLQEDFTLTDSLSLTGGLRYDDHKNFGSDVTPRVAIIYSLPDSLPGDTILKISHGDAFRAPNAYELYYDDGGFTNKGALVLEPERISTNEIILEHYFSDNIIGVISFYDYRIDDLIEQVTDPIDGLLVFSNVGRIDARGASLSLEGRWADWITGRVSYSSQTTEDARTGTTLTNSPRDLIKANMMVPLFDDRVTAGLEMQYISDRRTWSGRYADSATRVNLTLTSKDFVPGLSASASFYNLFDEQYGDPASQEHLQDILPQQGRAYRINLSYRF